MRKRLLFVPLFLGLALLFSGCGGGSTAAGGIPAGLRNEVNNSAVNLAMRVNIAPLNREIRAQLADIANIEIRVLDAQTFNELTPVVNVDPTNAGDETIIIPNVPVGFRIIRIEGFSDPPMIDAASGLPFANPGYSLDLTLNVQIGVENVVLVNIDNIGITGEVLNGGNLPVGVAGQVRAVADAPDQAEDQPDVDIVGLRYAITMRRTNSTGNNIIIADVHQTDSLNFAGDTIDIDGNPLGIEVNAPGFGFRNLPQIALDQLTNFSVIWEDTGTGGPRVINGRSYDSEALAIIPETADITISPFLGLEPSMPLLGSTTNPTPPPGEAPGGEVRHMLYLNSNTTDTFLGIHTFPPEAPDCEPGDFCPPTTPIVDCPCFFEDQLDLNFKAPFPFPQADSSIGLAVGQDGFADIVVFTDTVANNVWAVYARPWVGFPSAASPLEFEFQVNQGAGDVGEVDAAFIDFSFSEGRDDSVVVFEQDGEIFARSYAFILGEFGPTSDPVKIGDGTQPRVAQANNNQFYVTWVSTDQEVLLDLINLADMSRVSTNPPHQVSDGIVQAGTSAAPRVAGSSFGAIVVWEGDRADGSRGVFEKRFSVGFAP